MSRSGRAPRGAAAFAGALLALATAGCGSATPGDSGVGGRIVVAAAENFWGSLAATLGGSRVSVTSIVSNPETDPHAYEPTPRDGRSVAQAQYVIINGAGYDPWASMLVNASPSARRRLLNVAGLAGRRDGDNPHMWYSPAIVALVVAQITRDYRELDPGDAAYFDQQAATLMSSGMNQYDQLRAGIRSRYHGVPIGLTESVFVDLAADLELTVATPPAYMRAISEGTTPAAGDKSTFDSQIAGRRIKVLVFNQQNSTPDIQALITEAGSEGIPVVAVTETLAPVSETFAGWQVRQLDALDRALARAGGR